MVDLSRKVSLLFSFPTPREKMARRRPKTNSEGGRNPFPQTPRLPSALSWRRAERDAIMLQDFRQKKFELQSKSGAKYQKTENRPKKAKCKYQMEGGAEFPPETPLPPRPLHCWIFWGFPERKRRVRWAKKRGRGRGGVGSNRPFGKIPGFSLYQYSSLK